MTATSARLLWLAFVLPGALLLVIGIARAAEPHEITVTYPGKDYDEVRRTHFALHVYESREECLNAIVRVRVRVPGVRLKCDAVRSLREPVSSQFYQF